MDKDEARSVIAGLVEKYNKAVEDNRVKTYNEGMTKKYFIRPLFHTLGWNTTYSRDVSADEKIKERVGKMVY